MTVEFFKSLLVQPTVQQLFTTALWNRL